MIPDPRFVKLPKHFWANIRTVSQQVGYTARGTAQISVPTVSQIRNALEGIGLTASHLMNELGHPTELGKQVMDYFKHRAEVLNTIIAVWEIKEYYYTTTFGSRVADGVYETLLDGMELEELRKEEQIEIKHYLMVDSHYTWWDCGRPYLCRIMDMLHMGYVDEVLFGSEITERLPAIVKEWLAIAKKRKAAAAK
jgi:hypothetical protein